MSAVGTGADDRPASGLDLEQPRARGRAGVDRRGPDRRRHARQRRQPARLRGPLALLLGKAKDNNASCAIGPFIRLFDATFSLDDVRRAEVALTVEGDGRLRAATAAARCREISRDPADLVAPDDRAGITSIRTALVLFLGTMFAPVEDRDAPGQGFTHKAGDIVTIAAPKLGALVNRVGLATEAPPWTFGTAALMRNLAARGLL